MSEREHQFAYHEAGHAVVAYERFGSAIDEYVTLDPTDRYLDRYMGNSLTLFWSQKLTAFANGADHAMSSDDEQHYSGDPANDRADRMNHECDLHIDACLAGSIAEEIFCASPDDSFACPDWTLARTWAEKLQRGKSVPKIEPWNMQLTMIIDYTSYFKKRSDTVTKLLDGRYRQTIQTIVDRLLVDGTVDGPSLTDLIREKVQ